MPSSTHLYLSDADQAMVATILELTPEGSLSALFQTAVRQRYAELVGCEHEVCRCMGCGAVMGHPASTIEMTTAAVSPTRTAATSTAVLQIEPERRMGV